MQKNIDKVKTLLDALPFIKEFSKKIVVIKYGGSAQTSPELKEKFAQDVVLLSLTGLKPVIVHGGGKRISELLENLDITSEFVDGHRVTSKEAINVAEMVLKGEINSEIVSLLNHMGAKSIGLSGKDGKSIIARAKDGGKFGYTGEIVDVDSGFFAKILDDGYIPVIAPIADGVSIGHPGFNINADIAACEVAKALQAEKVLFLTDTVGVLDSDKTLVQTLTKGKIKALKDDILIVGGMIPKVDACVNAIDGGVKKAHIIDGRVEHSLLLELFTSDGVGTQILDG